MSGGVDSSVAAARLVDAGYDVVGVTLHLWDYPEGAEPGRCCAPEDQYDARSVCDALEIPHYTFDRRELFTKEVVSPFVDAYVEGETPSPCVHCNRSVKLNELFAISDRLGAAFIATGHYARVEPSARGPRLLRGKDRQKDQSYFLHTMVSRPDRLERMLLPLGEATKEEVRSEALARDLPGATKGESQELCFVPNGRYDAFVKERAPERVRPGPIVDDHGRVVGAHEGIHGFTIGQRKGLGVALGQPMFVAALDRESNTVRLGKEADLFAGGAMLAEGIFAPDVELPLHATIQVRARHGGAPGVLMRDPTEGLRVRFDEGVRAVSPGQIAVAYEGERVLGGAAIRRALPVERPRDLPTADGPA